MNDEYYQQLCNLGRSESALLEAVRQGNEKWVKRLLSQGVPATCTGVSGSTVLHMAASGGQFKFVKMFLDAGHDVNSVSSLGSTPMLAVVKAPLRDHVKIAICKLLIESGADPRIKDNNGRSTLDWAPLSGGSTELIDLIAAHVNQLNHSDANLPSPEGDRQ